MAVPTSALQGLTNKSIIELYSVELKADIHDKQSQLHYQVMVCLLV